MNKPRGTSKTLKQMLIHIKCDADDNNIECSVDMIRIIEANFCDFMFNQLTIVQGSLKSCSCAQKPFEKLISKIKSESEE